jgi:metallophosphoesterase (TIGR03767 family)
MRPLPDPLESLNGARVRPSRRDVLRAASLGGAALALPPAYFPSRRAARRPVDPTGTTLDTTVLRSPSVLRPGGYRLLVSGPGEPHVVRTDLGAAASANRANRRVAVVSFLQLTDIHLLDAQSPARVEFLDRYSDPPGESAPFEAAWRPQEPLTLHVADAVVRGARQVGRGPVTGLPFGFTVSTGDNVDNTQYNETRWFVDLLDGRTVTPDSGDPTKWEGVSDADPATYDVHYWHPDGTPSGKTADVARGTYGFPVVSGLLDAARAPFTASGVGTPWYAVFGNHDPLLQGNAPAYEEAGGTEVPTGFNAVATGPVKVVSLPAGLSPADAQRGLTEQDPAVLTALLAAPARTVTADAGRRPLTKREFMAEMFTTTGSPAGHGFAHDNVVSGKGYYAFDHGAYLRCVVLDTMNPGGYADGSLDPVQFAWLEGELTANAATGRLVVFFSHHTSGTMDNPVPYPTDTGQRKNGADVVALLLRFPHVVLWVNGHTHRNDVLAHAGPGGGFWEVNTAAHIDFPHQSRILEIVDNRDGTLSVFATIVDADAPLTVSSSASYASPSSARSLAALGRELGANDWQNRPADLNGGRRGPREARNVELLVKAPFDLGAGRGPRGVGASASARSGPAVIASTGLREQVPSVAAALAVAAAGLAASRRRAADEPEDA